MSMKSANPQALSQTQSTVLMSSQGFSELLSSQDGRDLFWTTDIKKELPIKMKGSDQEIIKPSTIPISFMETVSQHKHKPAVHVMRNNKHYTWTYG